MKDLSLHILDIAQNSVSAGASLVQIIIDENRDTDRLTITITDNGRGMEAEILEKVSDPFYTTRTTRKVGMGIPLFKQNAELSGGSFTITSEKNKGTELTAVFGLSHIDRPPMGDIAGVVVLLASGHSKVEWLYKHSTFLDEYVFDTREIKEVLGGVPLTELEVVKYLKEMIKENLEEIKAEY